MEQVIEFIEKLFGTESWPPRWHCGRWTDFHGWLYIISDLSVWAAYFVIPIFLIKLIRQRPGIPFPKVFYLFGAFILFCGTTHLVDASMFWWPAYRLNALVRFATGCISWFTIYALFKTMPQVLALRTSGEFEAELSERKKVEKKLNEYTKDLEIKNKEVEQFAYVASHDLQEPLRTISNYVGLFQKKYKGKLDNDSDDYLNFINGATGRMQALIKDLLEYSRIGHNKKMTEINCNKILQEVLNEMEASIKESGAEINSELLPLVNGYPDLKSLFQNLISNAIKFRQSSVKSIINITSQDKVNEWLFAVKDNGIGIDTIYHERVFTIFQKLHNQQEYVGTGIGLAHCKKIIELHSGKIWLESEPGKGSTFYFSIPKAKS